MSLLHQNRLLDSVIVDTVGTPIDGDGASKQISVWATSFGGGSVAIQISPDNGTTWNYLIYNGNPAVFTTNADIFDYKFSIGTLMRAVLTESTGASNVCAEIFN